MKRILMPLCFATTPMLFAFFVLFLLPFSHSFSFAATNNMEKIRNEQARKQELKQAREQARKQILERIRRGAGTKPDRPRLDKRDGPRLDKQDDPRLNDPRLYDGPLDDSSGEFGNEFSGCGSGDVPGPISCADLASNPASVSGHGWQTVTNTLSEASCNLGHTDSVSGPGQLVLYDNTYTVMCANGLHEPGVYVGETPPDSNWGAYVRPSETCKMKAGRRPSDGARVVEVIVCPAPDDGHRDDGDGRHDDRSGDGRHDDRGDGRHDDRGADGRTDAQREWDDRGADGRPDDRGDEQAIDSTVVEVKEISGIELTVEGSEVDGPEYQVPTVDETAEDNADDVGIEAGVEQNCTLDQPCHITRIELTVEGSEVDGPEYQGQQ